MVQLIPPYLGDEVKSSAERKVFEMLQDAGLEGYTILHSLGLPKHQSKVYGEIDFVVVCNRGIACLEIKGGWVECRDGVWIFTDRFGVEHRKSEGPFAQAAGNMFSLRKILKNQFSNYSTLQNILVGCGVVFPDIDFSSSSQEMIPEIVWDVKTQSVASYFDQLFDYWNERKNLKIRPLSPANMRTIIHFLRGNFTFIPTLRDRLNHVEKGLIRLTQEQFRLMDALRHNERLLIEGKAGSGKTLLATEYARRCADEGKRVLYLTFNKNLANSIKMQLSSHGDIKVINLHAWFGDYVPIEPEAVHRNPQKYFSEELPEAFFDWVGQRTKEELEALAYDVIVIDEGQDILRPIYLYSIDALLVNGLDQGRWAIFYDERQNLFNPEFAEGMEIVLGYPCVRFELFINCRNTIQIGQYTSELSGISIDQFLHENGEEVRCISYVDREDFRKQIRAIMQGFRAEMVDWRDVLFLSPKRFEKSMLAEIDLSVNELGDAFDPESKLPIFSTVQGYKGLDSKIVVLVDMDRISSHNLSKFAYVATTRARTLLYVVAEESFWGQNKSPRMDYSQANR